MVRFMSSSSSLHSSSFTFQSSKFRSSSISNRLKWWEIFWNRTGRQNDKSVRRHEAAQCQNKWDILSNVWASHDVLIKMKGLYIFHDYSLQFWKAWFFMTPQNLYYRAWLLVQHMSALTVVFTTTWQFYKYVD